ncbi:MAG TPA: hypothetical protein VN932_09245, partial [Rhizomicrobium sp.]|nr:hypothetical protein [Rhizomicrobium sp.]
GLAAVFIVIGTIAAYFLVKGLREGRFRMRFYYPYPAAPIRNGRDPSYIYRDRQALTYWVEAYVQLSAVIGCIVMIFILTMLVP